MTRPLAFGIPGLLERDIQWVLVRRLSRPTVNFEPFVGFTEHVLDEFRGVGALREGRFALSIGLHFGVLLQKTLEAGG
jgi:hypothetical protein